MQAQHHDGDSANQMDTQYHFSQPTYPDMGLGGLAEGGTQLPPTISAFKHHHSLHCYFPAHPHPGFTLNHVNNCRRGVLGVPTTAVPATSNISHDVAHQTNLPIPSGALLYAPTPNGIDYGYSSQDNGFMNVEDGSSGNFTSRHPTFAGGHNATMPNFISATNDQGTSGVQMGFPVNPSNTLNGPQTSQYCALPWNAMGGIMPDAFSIANTEATGNLPSQWDNMDFMDDMLADLPVVSGLGPVDDDVAVQTLAPAATPAVAPVIVAAPPLANPRIPCTLCTQTFVRASDRIRHENSKHLNIPGAHLCPLPGCFKSHGGGFSRADKLTEHLWKKHAGLGYVKRV
ncbi:hypothetical protein LSUB1_G007783 [Lachnellula subtilissima]|uniref:C2H2-type domain-containing protein n=1 Tax=Lachnellula subtilissima TaxID=602034 RepID=A0A8H8RE43_9HELO|nr:hypothetical protein LSUB1_G007783 [Lachnellula subtilissima]